MAKLLKLRRGTTSQHSSFTGAEGEVTVDTSKDTLVVHDGSTAGGVPLAKEAGNIASATLATSVTVSANNSTDETVYPVFVDGATGTQGAETDTGFTYNPNSGNLTIGGEIDAATGDFSGDVDIDGTLEADAVTVNGTALNTVIAGVTVTNATNAVNSTTFTASANDSTNETVYPVFVDGKTGAQGAETDTNYTYNPSTGLLSTAALTTTGNVVVGGTLQVDGTTTTVNSATLNVTDKNIVMAKGAANDAAADGGGITVESGGGDKTFNWVDATDAWTSSEHIHVPDNKKILIGGASGTVDGCELFHNGSDSYITNTGTGNLIIKGDDVHIQGSNGENMVNCNENGSVDLSHDSVKKFSTYSTGAELYGSEGADCELYFYADEGDDAPDQWKFNASEDASRFRLFNKASGSWETNIECNGDGNVELYHDGTKKIETTAAGVTVSGSVTDDKGNLRSIPAASKSSAHTLVAADAGKVIYTSSGGVTVPNSVLSTGDAITIINNSGSDQTITQGSGFTLYNTADASTGNRTLAGRGMATIWFSSSAGGYISGTGLS